MTSDLTNAPAEFRQLYKAGKQAAQAGDSARAHDLFRQAIEIDPYHEQVWLWLASVVEADEDRRVCFENVLELNPGNPTARRQLDHLDQKAVSDTLTPTTPQNTRQRRLLFAITAIILIAAVAVTALALGVF
ncbi:MAG: tetratricopeptide repeat protein [Anaerolineae bacterium]|nr:tetratricopeptide repeat protein [Anaerolineae bacterium]